MSVRHILKTSTITCLVAAVLLFAYARPIALLLYTKWEVRNATELWVVPTPLRVVGTKPSPGKTFSYFGYDFESPWTEVKRERKLESIPPLRNAQSSGRERLTPSCTSHLSFGRENAISLPRASFS